MISPFLSRGMLILVAVAPLVACGPSVVYCDEYEEGKCTEFEDTSEESVRIVCSGGSVGNGRMCSTTNIVGVCDGRLISKAVIYYYSRGKGTLQDAYEACQRIGGEWSDSPPRD
jgi:hypothetical protein